MASITQCKVLFLTNAHRVTQILSSCRKHRIDLQKTVKMPGIWEDIPAQFWPGRQQKKGFVFSYVLYLEHFADLRLQVLPTYIGILGEFITQTEQNPP
jgi:hypothetical protein